MKTRLGTIALIFLTILALLAAGCKPPVEKAGSTDQGAQESSEKPVAKSEQEEKPEQPKPTATATPEPKSKPSATPEPEEELKFSELRTPDELDSYRVVHMMTWESENTEDSGSMELTTEFVRNPPAQRIVMRDLKNEEESVESIQIGDTNYIKFGDEWTAIQSEDQEITEAGDFWTPETFLGEGEGRYLGKENINGVDTRHYRYDKTAFMGTAMITNLESAQADVWVSTKFNVYARVEMHVVGVDDDGNKVTFTLVSNLTSINESIKIEAPEGVEKPGLPDDVPVMDNAEELSAFGQISTYKVKQPTADVIAFYKKEMPANGWKMGEAVIETMMDFTKGDRKATVMIDEDGEYSSVTVMMGE